MTKLDALGKEYKEFLVTKYQPIEELDCTLIELVHEPTGASVIHIEADDDENLFCMGFQTLPASSNGVAHILEHIVLCGSKKFPIKDPFFAMTRRSLNTFMNAMTGADFTCYPASSQVEKDFYNLLEVYLDAVFHPELKKLSFLQEGHRLEFTEPKNPESPLIFKGVVFNEMKGALNSGDSRLWHSMMKHLVPDLPYAYNSGGEPKYIPQLTHDELVEFHRTFYHPSRCLFFFYGNLPLKQHLDFIHKHALKDVVKIGALPPLPQQKRFTAPSKTHDRYPISETEPSENKTMIAFSWLTCPISDQMEVLSLSLLDSILMDTDASPLKIALLKSGLCLQADSYIDAEMSEIPFMILCKGCEKKSADALQKLIFQTLEQIVQEKIPSHLIESSLHQMEFARKEIGSDSMPFGLNLFFRTALLRQHGCDTENALMIHSLFLELRKKLEDPGFLPSLIEKYILQNPHFIQLIMEPDPNLQKEEQNEEQLTLDLIQKNLDELKTKTILDNTNALEQYQKEIEHQSLDCLPKIELKDIPEHIKHFPLKEEKIGDVKVYRHDCFTNHILYADLLFDFPKLESEELKMIPLFTNFLTEIAFGGRNYKENLEALHLYTGGFGAFSSLYVQAQNPKDFRPAFCLKTKSLYRNADKLFSLIYEVISSSDWKDKERIKELFLQVSTSLEHRIQKNAMKYAIQLSTSGFSEASSITNQWYGLNFFQNIRKIASDLNKNLNALIETFEVLSEKMLCLDQADLVLSCDEEKYKDLEKNQFYGMKKWKHKKFTPYQKDFPIDDVSSQAYEIASPVAFTSMAYECVGYEHKDAAALLVSTQLFENLILHTEIREKGGAYGSGASYFPTSSHFYFYSYRDPHLSSTIKTFHKAIDHIGDKKFNDRELEKAKLCILQNVDAPISPGSRALTAYSWMRTGKTHEMRDAFRDKIISVTKDQIADAVNEHLGKQKEKGIIISFADRTLLERENKSLTSPLPIKTL